MKKEKNIISIKKAEGINPKKEPLTVEKLKELIGRPDMGDEKSQEIVFSIKALVSILVEE